MFSSDFEVLTVDEVVLDCWIVCVDLFDVD